MIASESSSRPRITPALVGVAIFTALAVLLYYVLNFRGLNPDAMDLAQIGRNISEGRGFSTDFVRPLALPWLGGRAHMPDMLHEPLYPFLLGAGMAVAGARDGLVVGLSGALFVLCAVLLCRLAYRLSGSLGIAAFTVAAVVLCPPLLTLAISGSPLVLATCWLLSMLLVLTPQTVTATTNLAPGATTDTDATDEQAARSGGRRFLFAGVLAALCYLTDYSSLIYTIPLAMVWGREGRRWNKRTVSQFAIGFILVVLPWWIRNARLAGNPFFTLQWLDFTMRSTEFPGSSLLRDIDKGRAMSLNLYVPGPKAFLLKLFKGLEAYFNNAPRIPHLYLLPFIVVAYWLPPTSSFYERVKRGALWATLLYILLLCALGRQDISHLLPLAGLLAYIGVTTARHFFQQWLVRWAERREAAAGRDADFTRVDPAVLFRVRAIFSILAVLLLLLPFIWQTLALRGSPKANPEPLRALGKALPEKRYVVTDVPWAVAWYANRPATWIPQQAAQLAAIEQAEPVGSVYLSPALLSYPPEENAGEWQRVYQQVGDIPGFNKVPRPKMRDVVYLKMPTLAEAGAAVKAKPTDVGAQLQLGQAQLAGGATRAALATFVAAQRIKPAAFEAYQGAGTACLRLKDYSRAIDYLQHALQIAPRDQRTLLSLAEAYLAKGNINQAIEVYERVLADAPDQAVAINNLAFLYTQTNRYPYRALEMAKRGVLQDPANGSKWDTLGWASYRAGRVQEALAQLRQAAKLTPHEAAIQTHLNQVLQAAGKSHQVGKSAAQAAG